MDTRPFLDACFAHEFYKVMDDDELLQFSEWLKELLDEQPAETHPGFLLAFALGDGTRGYLQYPVGPGAWEPLVALGFPLLHSRKGDGTPTLSVAQSELPCWEIGKGDIHPNRF